MCLFGPDLSRTDKGVAAFKKRAWKRAWRYFEDAAEDGENPRREYYLGLIYWRGLGVTRDAHMAVTHFSRAAELDHAAAMTAFGIALRAGVGVEKDTHSERAWVRTLRAAKGIKFKEIWVQHRDESVTKGQVAIYFFPLGQSEKSVVELTDGSEVFSVLVFGLTGRVELHDGALRDVNDHMLKNAMGDHDAKREDQR